MENQVVVGAMRRRRQKIYSSYYGYRYKGGYFKPQIKITGNFLKDFGFEINQLIDVAISEGKIIITKVPKDYLSP